MKKILILLICSIFLCGCNKFNIDDAVKKFEKIVNDTTNYTMEGTMEIVNNEEIYTYDVEVDYMKGDFYKVRLLNKSNDHEQIILKNEEGVYVITPSLNKSFKFQSDWPNNSSQTYILSSLLNDLKFDESREMLDSSSKYVLKSKVNYPNNSNLVNQKLTFDKNMKLEKVEVFNEEGNIQIKFIVKILDLKAENKMDTFSLDSIIDKTEVRKTQETGVLEEIIYPMYIPNGTKYSGEEKVKNENSERVILTYTGEKPFIMIEETSYIPDDIEVRAVNGELVSYGNIVGVLTDTSLNWSNNNIEYYLISSSMNAEELLQIASSTSSVAVALQK